MMRYGYGNMMGNGYGNMMDGYNGYHMFLGGGFGLITLILIIAIAFVFYKLAVKDRLARSISNDDALEILKQRYARGEIDEEQYKNMIATLNSK